MHALIGFFIILFMQAFVISDLCVCFYFNHVVGTDLKEVGLCGLAQAWGAICTMGLCFLTPHATTCLLCLLLVTTVYSNLFSSSFFLSTIVITCSTPSCRKPHRHHATSCLLHLTSLGCFPDPLSLSHNILSHPSSPPNTIYKTQCQHQVLTPGLMPQTKWPSA